MNSERQRLLVPRDEAARRLDGLIEQGKSIVADAKSQAQALDQTAKHLVELEMQYEGGRYGIPSWDYPSFDEYGNARTLMADLAKEREAIAAKYREHRAWCDRSATVLAACLAGESIPKSFRNATRPYVEPNDPGDQVSQIDDRTGRGLSILDALREVLPLYPDASSSAEPKAAEATTRGVLDRIAAHPLLAIVVALAGIVSMIAGVIALLR